MTFEEFELEFRRYHEANVQKCIDCDDPDPTYVSGHPSKSKKAFKLLVRYKEWEQLEDNEIIEKLCPQTEEVYGDMLLIYRAQYVEAVKSLYDSMYEVENG